MNQDRWRRTEEFFHAALECAPQQRQAFLDQACNGDAELRLRVEALLRNDQQAASFLDQPAIKDPTAALAASVSLEGREFGQYRIGVLLGAGGMGEVYRAHDDKLGRDVAVKVLPYEFARDAERLALFRHEARTLASLNHPNIAAVYGLEKIEEAHFLVMELVEGETLRGPLPVADSLERARQVAEALEVAHDKGIIHRDLKPSNVRITPEGRVKVLDFGLAEVVSRAEADQSLAGRVVGTPGYMSPEQTLGKDADKQMDIWAFGCLLYELLTGKRAFPGESGVIAAVPDREPDWQALPAKTPVKIRELLRHCLHKDRDRRLSDIAHARRVIQHAQRGWNRWQVAAIAAGVLAILGAGTAVGWRGPVRPPDSSAWVQLTKFPDSVSQPALSPDGRMLAFVRGESTIFGQRQVYVKALPDGEPLQLTRHASDAGIFGPAFSPDGKRIFYTVVSQGWDTWVVPVRGGEPKLWRKAARGLVWTGPRRVLYSVIRAGVFRGVVSSDESAAEQDYVYLPTAGLGIVERPHLSPDGKWLLLTGKDREENWMPCRVVPADGGAPGRAVGPPQGACTAAAWSPDGEWMYLTSDSGGDHHIWRQRFPDGEPEQLTSGPTSEEGIAMAPDGRSFVTAVALHTDSLWIHDERGERQISPEGHTTEPRFTPDGEKLVYRVAGRAMQMNSRDAGEVTVMDLDSGRSEPLVRGWAAFSHDISADGTHVVIETAAGEGKGRFWIVPLDRSTPPQAVPNAEGRTPRFGPDGDIFFRRAEGSAWYIFRVHPDGTGMRKAIEQSVNGDGRVSRDGKWIEAWAPLPGNGRPAWQLFPLGGGRPILIGNATKVSWSLDGRWSYLYPSASAWHYVVPLRPGEGVPRLPPEGVNSEEEAARLPGARRIDGRGIVLGPSADVYAFYRSHTQRNLYRIPIP